MNPIGPDKLTALNPLGKPAAPASPSGQTAGDDFAKVLRDQLDTVSKMQGEAEAGLQSLASGESVNMTGVFVNLRKAEVAFTLLMEIRNKLVDAYNELKDMRV